MSEQESLSPLLGSIGGITVTKPNPVNGIALYLAPQNGGYIGSWPIQRAIRTGDRVEQPSTSAFPPTPHQEQSTQVVLAYKPFGFLPLLAWNQSGWDGGLHPRNRFSPPGGVVPLPVGWFYRHSLAQMYKRRKHAYGKPQRSFLPIA